MPEQTQPTTDYLLLFRNTAWHQDLAPQDVQRVMTEWMAWFDGLVADGRCLGGQSLTEAGRVIKGPDRQATDGPYAESRESIAGYFHLRVASLDEATAIARQCPGLPHGASVEIREAFPRCKASLLAGAPGEDV